MAIEKGTPGRGSGRRLPAGVAFWTVAVVYAMYLFTASAPSPLYVIYQAQWGFSAITLTVIFAVYVMAVLVALIFAGSISDHIGRRPTLLAAGSVQIAALVVFAVAPDVGWLLVARVLQGAATGLATGTLNAYLLDLQPAGRPGPGATVSSAAQSAGLALGGIGAGLLVEYAPAPTHLVYWLLVAFFALALLAMFVAPETVRPDAVWWRSLSPRVGVAASARGVFAAVTPCLIAIWAVLGLFLALGPSLTAGLVHSRSHLVGGLIIFLFAGTSTVAALVTAKVRPRVTMLAGCAALALGMTAVLVAVHDGSTGVLFAGSVVSGAGFGFGFTGALRLVVAAAPVPERAALVTAVYVVSYLAFSMPAIAAGIAVTHVGLLTTTTWYGVAVIVLAVAAAAATALRRGAATKS